MVLRILHSWDKRTPRLVKFGLVGGSGVLINELVTGIGLFTLPTTLSAVSRSNIAVFLGWITSVLTNFLLNYHWTWKDRKDTFSSLPIYQLSKYYISAIAAFIVQISVVNSLAVLIGWDPLKILGYNLIGILSGMLINFLMADKWVFK